MLSTLPTRFRQVRPLLHTQLGFAHFQRCSQQSASRSAQLTTRQFHCGAEIAHDRAGTNAIRMHLRPWWALESAQLGRRSITRASSCNQCLWMGSKAGSGIEGSVHVENNQRMLDVDQDRLRNTLSSIRAILGYDTYDVSLFLVTDAEMKRTNRETRGVNAPTDILSFPFYAAVRAGVLEDPEFDIPDYYMLGDIMVDVPYVIRRCRQDQEELASSLVAGELDGRGVSGAMATVFDPEKRIHMLLVHGMLHLLGYDHENDTEYEQMVTREDEVLEKLNLSFFSLNEH